MLCHGTPPDDLVGLLDDNAPDGTRQRDVDEVAAALDGIDAALILCGHTRAAPARAARRALGLQPGQRRAAGVP